MRLTERAAAATGRSKRTPSTSVGLTAAFLVACAACGQPPGPNVLLITVDTLRADRLGCYGFALAQTPAIDALAARGVRCRNAVTVAPLTLPAHASILTGLYPPAHGVRDNGAYALGDQVTTLAERLRQAGWETRAFVSALVLDRQYNLAQGFEGYDDDLWSEDAPPLFMIRERPADRTAARVLAWLEHRSTGRPFFAWVHFFDPHQPYRTAPGDRVLAPTRYDAEIAGVDRAVGRMTEVLTHQGLLDDTLVVLTADHGESLGEHGEETHGLFIYDATLRVPLIWRHPRLLPPGTTYDGPVRAVDVVPTMLAALGLPGRDETQGVDLLPALQGRAPAPELPQYAESLLSEAGFGMAPLHGLRVGTYKWVRAPEPELYDLAADPDELRNIYSSAPEVAARLDRELETILVASRRFAVEPVASPLDARMLETLQALGYLAPPAERASLGGMDPKRGIQVYAKLEQARQRAQQDDWAGAERLLREVLAATPANVTARNILALAAARRGDREAAVREYRASLAVAPRQHRVRVMLGTLLLERDDLDAAEAEYRAALAITPRFAEALAGVGFVEAARGREAAAEAWYAQALAGAGAPHVYRRIADRYYQREDFARALVYYEKLLTAVPAHFEALVQAGNSARYTGAPSAATTYYERARALRPDSWIPPYNLSCLRATAGEPGAALALLDEALERGLRSPRLLAENEDFATLHALPAWKNLLARAKQAAPRP
jgi:arylsulfatase A-like enzyme/Tfp pilus assembly protein PilF